MRSITRWVLAHKRIVAAFWILVTIVGIATVGSSTQSFSKEFSVPGREGFVTNDRIAADLPQRRQQRAATRCRDPPARHVGVLAGGSAAVSSRSPRSCSKRSPGARTASYASTGNRAFVSADGRTTFVLAYPPPDNESFGTNTKAAKTATAVLAGRSGRRCPGTCDRPRRAPEPDRRQRRTGRSARVDARRARRAGGARVRVRVPPGVRPDPDGDRLDHGHVPGPVGRDLVHERVDDRRVPRGADRARRRDRLLAARRRPLARGESPRQYGGGRRRPRDGDSRPRRSVQRYDRRDRSPRDGRAAPAVPALNRLRRDADSFDQRDRRGDAASDRPRQGRRPTRLAPHPQRRHAPAARGRRGPGWSSADAGSRRPRPSVLLAALLVVRDQPRSPEPRTSTRSPNRAMRTLAWSRWNAPASAPARSSRSRCSRPPRPTPPPSASALRDVPGVHGAVAPTGSQWRASRHRGRRRAPGGRRLDLCGPRHDHERPHRRPTRRASASASAASVPRTRTSCPRSTEASRR